MRSFALSTRQATYRVWMNGVTAGKPCPPLSSGRAICFDGGRGEADNVKDLAHHPVKVKEYSGFGDVRKPQGANDFACSLVAKKRGSCA